MKNIFIPVAYKSKISKKDTLILLSKMKQNLNAGLIENFNLLEIENKYITIFNEYYSEKRTIDFDNKISGDIYQISSQSHNYLIGLINELEFNVEEGLITWFTKFNRDNISDISNSINEFCLNFQYKILISEINEVKMIEIVNTILSIINNSIINCGNNNMNKLKNNLKIIDFDKLSKRTPTLNIKDSLDQFVINNDLVLVLNSNKVNRRGHRIIEDKLSTYGPHTASLFCYHERNNEILNIANISFCPTITEAKEKIENSNLDSNQFIKIFETLSNENNILGVEINFSKLMIYVLDKYTIGEITPTVNSSNNILEAKIKGVKLL